MSETPREELQEWVGQAEAALDRLEDQVAAGEFGSILETLHDLVEVADAAEDLLGEVELSALPDAIDGSELIDAFEAGEIPDAIAERDASEMINLRALMKAVELRNIWNSMDVTGMLDEKEDLEEEVGDLTDEETADLADDIESVVGGGVDSADTQSLTDMPSQEWQEAIQAKAIDAVDEFREGVIEAHQKLKQRREENREKMRRQHDETQAESRNVTAYSSMPTQRPDIEGNSARFSTVPQGVRHSTAPSFTRVYGDRYDQE